MPIISRIYFTSGESVDLEGPVEGRLPLVNFESGESMITLGQGRTLYFNPAHITHILEEEQAEAKFHALR